MQLNLIKFLPIYFVISLLVILPGLYYLITQGLRPAVDFTGGTLIEVTFSDPGKVNDQVISETLGDRYEIGSIQQTPESFMLRTSPLQSEQINQLVTELSSISEATLIRSETVGPILGRELIQKTLAAVVVATLAILLYIAYRFRSIKYGVCAVLAMLHDSLVVLGVFAILGHFYQVEVDTLFVTALLTILSFSVHDTIVVYDRIRETLSLHYKADFDAIVNKSIVETLARSINNSMTIIFMLLSLFLFGGESIRWFIFALLIGTITGTYSSTFTAAPLLVTWEKVANKLKRSRSR